MWIKLSFSHIYASPFIFIWVHKQNHHKIVSMCNAITSDNIVVFSVAVESNAQKKTIYFVAWKNSMFLVEEKKNNLLAYRYFSLFFDVVTVVVVTW